MTAGYDGLIIDTTSGSGGVIIKATTGQVNEFYNNDQIGLRISTNGSVAISDVAELSKRRLRGLDRKQPAHWHTASEPDTRNS